MADSSRNSEIGVSLHHDAPTFAITAIRVTGISTLVMVVMSFIICLVKGSSNHTFYLLACNLVISSIIGLATAWWYKNGDLQANKYWFIILVGAVIIFQCLTTDVYVFNVPHSNEPTQPPTTKATLLDVSASSL